MKKTFFYYEDYQTLAQTAQRGCEASLFGDIQTCLDKVLRNLL